MDEWQHNEYSRRFEGTERIEDSILHAKSRITGFFYGAVITSEKGIEGAKLWLITNDMKNEQRKGVC